MPSGGKRKGSGRKFINARKTRVYIQVRKEDRDKIRQLAKDKNMTIIDFISYLIKTL